MKVIGIRCSSDQYQLLYEMFGSPKNMLDCLLSTQGEPKADNTDMTTKLDAIIELLSSTDKKPKIVKNKDFQLSDEEFEQSATDQFKKILGIKYESTAISMSKVFTEYWLEKTKSGIPKYQTEKTWELPKRVFRWIENNRSKNPSYANNRQSNKKVDDKSEFERIQTTGRRMEWNKDERGL
jgi:hypothetical protein